MTQLLLVTAALSAFYAAARLQAGGHAHHPGGWSPFSATASRTRSGGTHWKCLPRPQSYWALNSTSATQKSRSEVSRHACWTPGHHCPASSTSTFPWRVVAALVDLAGRLGHGHSPWALRSAT